jgi:hypothetical protein
LDVRSDSEGCVNAPLLYRGEVASPTAAPQPEAGDGEDEEKVPSPNSAPQPEDGDSDDEEEGPSPTAAPQPEDAYSEEEEGGDTTRAGVDQHQKHDPFPDEDVIS